MNEQVAMDVMKRMDAMEARMASYRQGLVTATSPNIQVQLGGATTSYTNVASGVPVTTGDVVACLMLANGHDMLIIAVLSGASGAPSPVGMIAGYAGSSDPPGGAWLIADHRSVLRASYPDAFACWGTDFGAVDGTHFNLPDGEDCVLLGAGGLTSLNDTGGANTSNALLSHTHAGPSHTHSGPSHNHSIGGAQVANFGSQFNAVEFGASGAGSGNGGTGNTGSGGTGNTGSAGSGSSFSIVQKHIGTNFIIRVLP